MKLRVLLPTHVLIEAEATSVTAEGGDGAFTLKERHIDFTSALVPGILAYRDEAGEERFLAVDRGVLVKVGDEVLVSVGRGAVGDDLGSLQRTVEEDYAQVSEREKQTLTAMSKLEAGFVRRFMELREHGF